MKKILVVEDNKRIREIITFTLKNKGYSIDEAEDGEKAQELINHTTYDLLILDVMLPGVTGFEIAEHVREKKLNSKILMLSAITQGTSLSDQEMQAKAQVDAFVSKPFKINDLSSTVDSLLQSS
ncbi:MAG: response regulator [Planctomycetes bacterium]|nr:response regulator [Planctomycetota bacterium]